MNYKSETLETIMRARDIWAAGDNDGALELLNEAHENLVCHGQSAETMPSIFAHIAKIREHLIAKGAGA